MTAERIELTHIGELSGRVVAGGRREQAKSERRARIIAAAHDVISRSGVDAVSMRQLAIDADVSLSTVYNLFESKEAVLSQLFNENFYRYERLVHERASQDPFERFMDSVDLAAEFYQEDIEFSKSQIWLVGRGSDLKITLQQPRVAFFYDLVRHAIDAGALVPTADAEIVGSMIIPLNSAAYQLWATGAASIDEFRVRAKLGMVIVLKAFVQSEWQARLDAYLSKLEAWLKAQQALSQSRIGG